MNALTIIALVLVIPILLVPVALIWYINIQGLKLALKHRVVQKEAVKQTVKG